MLNPLSCIIVDDDEIDRLTTLSFVKQYPWLQVSGVFTNAVDALDEVTGKLPDVAFLDVDMPGMSGLDLRRRLNSVPACIIITAFPEYAVESFEVAALDFMVKPIRSERFATTANRLRTFFTIREKASLLDHSFGGDTILIKDGHEQVKLALHEIYYLEALKDYTRIVTANAKHHVLASIGNLLKAPEFAGFVRIHKSFAVQKHFVDRMKTDSVMIKDIELPVGRVYKENLIQLK